MHCFAFAWELGGGLGHTIRLARVARPLLERGHRVHFVLRDLSSARTALGGLADHPGACLWQAPLWLPVLGGVPEAASYAELLFRAGYLDAQRLAPVARAWRALFDATCAQVLLADHAPTALLAARGIALRTAVTGTGFGVPPQACPMPAFRTWQTVPEARLRTSEQKALQTANAVLDGLGAPPLARLCELVRADETLLFTWPELDHYDARGPDSCPAYLGALPGGAEGGPPEWPPGEGPAVFAYLKADQPGIETVLERLRDAPVRTLAHVPGLSAAQCARLASTRMAFARRPVRMDAVCAVARAVVCNAGAGTVLAALGAGLPLVMLPMHAEQMLCALRVQEAGAGVALAGADAAAGLPQALGRVLGEPSFSQAAAALALRHAPRAGHDAASEAADRLQALAAAAA